MEQPPDISQGTFSFGVSVATIIALFTLDDTDVPIIC
jgi:hypothetical protein